MAIPLPGTPGSGLLEGLRSGTDLFRSLIEPKLKREGMQQDWQKHLDDLSLRQQQEARLGQMAPLQQQLMQAQVQQAIQKNKEREMLQQLMSGDVANVDPEFIQGGGEHPSTLPTIPNISKPAQGANLDKLRDNLEFRAMFKANYGIDPKSTTDRPYQGAAREADDLQRLIDKEGIDSEVVQNALSLMEDKKKAREILNEQRSRTVEGLKPGERWIKDEEGKVIGKESAPTPKERTELHGRGFLNYAFPIMSKGFNHFSGKGSWTKFNKYSAMYGKDEKATNAIDDFLLAMKFLPSVTSKEMQTLGTPNQQKIFERLRGSLKSADIPEKMSDLNKQFVIPPAAFAKADDRFLEELNKAQEHGEKSVSPFIKRYFDSEQGKESSEVNELVIIIDPQGKRHRTPAYNAKNLPKGWRRG